VSVAVASPFMFEYEARRRRLAERMEAEGIAALFLPVSADLEYLSGVERQIPFFGQSSYAHGWASGALFVTGAEPVFVFPRMFVTFDLRERPDGELVVVNETDDGESLFARAMSGIPSSGKVAVGDRIWGEALLHLGRVVGFDRLVTGSRLVNDLRRVKDADELAAMGRAIAAAEQAMAAVTPLVQPGVSMAELAEAVDAELRRAGSRCPSFTTHVFTNFGPGELDSGTETARTPIPEGTSVMFDFGGVVDGYCSDFGRTIYCGDPPEEVREVYDVMLAAQAAGLAAAAAGVPAREVNAACRRPIEEAGLGEHFRHRMGHGIGMDVHERPFLSEEDATPLEPGMTFTDEPSVMWNGRFGVRIEDVIVCEEGGGRRLNSYPPELVAVS
jgi:Xaa-Pro aminopeptidase